MTMLATMMQVPTREQILMLPAVLIILPDAAQVMVMPSYS